MAINRISGNILQDDLVRGANLAFQGNLVYIDIVNQQVGINTVPSSFTLDVNGNIRSTNISTGNANVGNLNSSAGVFSNVISVTGNANVGNLGTAGIISATGNITGGNLITSGVISATGTITSSANIIGGNLLTVGLVSATANITGGNLITSGLISAIGNALVGNIDTASGTFSNTISVTGNASVGNLGTPGLITASGNVLAGNLLTTGIVSATGNATAGNILTLGTIIASGNIISNSNVVAGNIVIGNSSIVTIAGLLVLAPASNVSVSNTYINDLLDPIQSSDAATKFYVDSAAANAAGNLGNITLSNTTISTSYSPGNITILPTGNSTVIFSTTSGAVMPVGNTAQRPSPVSAGTVRFNSDIGRMEIYDGSQWQSVVSGVTNQVLQGDNTTTVFVLNQASTTPATLVSLNGVVQLPGTSYSVTGNSITFTQAPAISDVIDVRFL